MPCCDKDNQPFHRPLDEMYSSIALDPKRRRKEEISITNALRIIQYLGNKEKDFVVELRKGTLPINTDTHFRW
jgi:hypothetical protein